MTLAREVHYALPMLLDPPARRTSIRISSRAASSSWETNASYGERVINLFDGWIVDQPQVAGSGATAGEA